MKIEFPNNNWVSLEILDDGNYLFKMEHIAKEGEYKLGNVSVILYPYQFHELLGGALKEKAVKELSNKI